MDAGWSTLRMILSFDRFGRSPMFVVSMSFLTIFSHSSLRIIVFREIMRFSLELLLHGR